MKPKFPTLKSKRLTLREIIISDLENVFKGLSHPDIVKYYGISFDSLEATKEQMKWFSDLEKNGTGIWWAVCDIENGEFLGACGFNNLSKAHNKAEIGFWLLPDYWRKGIMKETIPLIVNFAFQSLDLHRIEAFVETENTNCKSLLSRLNFELEETMNDCEIKNDSSISLDIYTKLSHK